jgi:hypothetical protein
MCAIWPLDDLAVLAFPAPAAEAFQFVHNPLGPALVLVDLRPQNGELRVKGKECGPFPDERMVCAEMPQFFVRSRERIEDGG